MIYSLGTRPLKIEKEGLVNGMGWDGMEVYTAPGMQVHFRLASNYHSDVHLLE